MIKVLLLFFLSTSAFAFVPTVESLLRNGSNAEITTNGVSIALVVKKVQAGEKTEQSSGDASLLQVERDEDYYKLFITKDGDSIKLAQARYKNKNFNDEALEHKVFYPRFNAFTLKATSDQSEKGIFFGLIDSLALNNGAHLVNYLKTLSVPVKLNSEIINREKVEFLASYKRYLYAVSKDPSAKKTEANPMKPEDSTAKDRVDAIMNEPMYVDTKNVSLTKDSGSISWMINAGAFEAIVSQNEREVQRLKFKSQNGDFEIVCKDYWLANGIHRLPRFLFIKDYSGQNYQVEILSLRHYVEKEEDLSKRLKAWDTVLKGKISTGTRPAFLF